MSDMPDLFVLINNAVLDLQSSQLATYERPLKTLARLLRHEDLQEINSKLTKGLDLDSFLAHQELRRGSSIVWPDDPEEALGLTLLLILKFADDPNYMQQLGYYYGSGTKVMSGVTALVSQIIIPFARDYKIYVESKGQIRPKLVIPNSNKIFIVHGHDDGATQSLARFLEKLQLQVIILKEQPNQGRTIIEKYEQSAAEVGFAVVLMTPDDFGAAVSAGNQKTRARQNVIFELGYFAGKLGRGRVCLLRKGDVEIPSDLFGVVYTEMDSAEGWKPALVKELKAAGIKFDANRMWD